MDHEIGCVRLAIPQPTEGRCIVDQIKAAMIFARSDFVNVIELREHAGRIQRAVSAIVFGLSIC